MRRRTDRLHDLPGKPLDRDIRGGLSVLRHGLIEVARDASLFGSMPGSPERQVVGPGDDPRHSLADMARTCLRDYVLRGGTMEFDSMGALHAIWVRVTAATGGGTLAFGPKTANSGLLLLDLSVDDNVTVSIVFRDAGSVAATYDVDTDITLIGLLSGAPTELDCNAWAVVRLRGNACGLNEGNSRSIAGDNGQTSLYIRQYLAGDTKEIRITVKK
ncbi:hypothetical protein [Komagataeibacter swingsii]|uniref:Uncharacterized protein n=1 Tax=Komagataeibacter swingsii TaxID=215220 RepID=A0A2V4RLC7_9PROT|nr:hypothetical protein [Komagataeibacter swingsii]PYD70606.1 hypothetical protein CFR76_04435 [Komagataeibacter swingsii]GBQ58914.1 hypothetical protein AA16373_1408 [Komagataeibacter swingsii DSM 16373]